ncbi:hypothetical protein NDU88_006736 [Pleurodeles waltl]|uniref:Secreted protein n=1 Tax=Pleurodeles waltl TaxID=8319 RepID=A0AAV7ULX0_PLEWA|nr:hypothetical protein NDU88_006736 [Pleurodeles waltl]
MGTVSIGMGWGKGAGVDGAIASRRQVFLAVFLLSSDLSAFPFPSLTSQFVKPCPCGWFRGFGRSECQFPYDTSGLRQGTRPLPWFTQRELCVMATYSMLPQKWSGQLARVLAAFVFTAETWCYRFFCRKDVCAEADWDASRSMTARCSPA